MLWLIVLARRAAQGRVAVLGCLALVVALGLGTAIASLTAAWRTEHAYPDYLRKADISELVVNPSMLTDRISELIASTPGVVGVTSDSLLVASVDDGAPRTRAEVDSTSIQVRVSGDGRYVENDRPVVHDGRMIGSGPEAFLSVEAAAELGAAVGDELPIAFWRSGYNEPAELDQYEVVEPVGHASARVVGIGVFADEVLADELYPRLRILVTPEVAGRFDCTPLHPPSDDSLTIEELGAMLVPPDCALGYRYFSLSVGGGDGGVAAVTTALSRLMNEENAGLPMALLEQDIRVYPIPAVTAEERDRVQHSLDPTVAALRLFGVAAAVSTLVLAVLATIRLARRAQSEVRVWHHLGANRFQRTAAVALPPACALLAGVAGAVVVGWLASGIGPLASARAVNPNPELVVVVPVVLPVVTASVLALGAGVAGAAAAAARVTSGTGHPRASRTVEAAGRTGSVALTLGVRSAVSGVGGPALLGSGVAAVAAVLASMVFSTNISEVVSHSARYGWPYDAAVVIGFGYGGADRDRIAATLDRPEVNSWGIAATGASTINGATVPAIAARTGFDEFPLAVVEGTVPVGDEQVALGARTADQLGIDVGDTVTVATTYGAHEGTVSGLVVLPPVGPYQSDRAGLGTGVLLSATFFEKAVSVAEQRAGLAQGELADAMGSFVAINLRDGVDIGQFMSTIADDVAGWDSEGWLPFVHTKPVRPAQIADVAAMRSAPVLLAALVALAMAVGLTLAIGLAVRTRRRELAILKALGGTSGQLRATLRWQSLTVVATGLIAGIPLGLALGMTTWRAFARNLGIPTAPSVSALWIVVLISAALAIALVASAAPGHLAARISPPAVLRDE